MAALAQELGRRGHRTTFAHMADAEPLVEGRGLPFHGVGQGSHPPGSLPGILGRMGAINGPFGLAAILRDVAASTDMLCRELPGALRTIGADCLVCDGTEAAGGLVAEHLGMPFVSVANALPLNREPTVPPPFVGWRYDPSRWGLERNAGGYRVSDLLMRRHAAIIAGYAGSWKLPARQRIDQCLSPLAQIAQLVPGLDFPRLELPETFHYVGRLRSESDGHALFVMPASDGRPLGYASLGTLQGGRASLFRQIADVAERARLRLVLAHAGGLTPEQVADLPGRPAAFDFVPQDAVLRHARLAILNGGINTVLDALAAGVPVVVVPIAFEQAAIARRLEYSGAGVAVAGRAFRARRLGRAVRTVLDDSGFQAAAERLAGELRQAGGVRMAANIVERVAATGRPVTRDMADALCATERAA